MRSDVVGSSVGLVAGVSIAAATYFCARSKLFYPVAVAMVPVGYMVGRVVESRRKPQVKRQVEAQAEVVDWERLPPSHQRRVMKLRGLYRGETLPEANERLDQISRLEGAPLHRALLELECALYYPEATIEGDHCSYRGVSARFSRSVGEYVAAVDLVYVLDAWYAEKAAVAGHPNEVGLWRVLCPHANFSFTDSAGLRLGFSKERSREARREAIDRLRGFSASLEDEVLIVTPTVGEPMRLTELLDKTIFDLIDEVKGESTERYVDRQPKPIDPRLLELMERVMGEERGDVYLPLLESVMVDWFQVGHRLGRPVDSEEFSQVIDRVLSDESSTTWLSTTPTPLMEAYAATFEGVTSHPSTVGWWRYKNKTIGDVMLNPWYVQFPRLYAEAKLQSGS